MNNKSIKINSNTKNKNNSYYNDVSQKLNKNIVSISNNRQKALYEYIKSKTEIKYDKKKHFSFFIDKHINYTIDKDFDFNKIRLKKYNASINNKRNANIHQNLEIFEHNMKLVLLNNISDILIKYLLFSYLKGKQHAFLFFIKIFIAIGLIFIPPFALFGISFLTIGGLTIMNILINSVGASAALGLCGLNIRSYKKIKGFIGSSDNKLHLLKYFLFDKRKDGNFKKSTFLEKSVFKKCRQYLKQLFKNNIFMYHDPNIEKCEYFAVKIDLDSFVRNGEEIYFDTKVAPIIFDDKKITYKSVYSKYIKSELATTNNNNKLKNFRSFKAGRIKLLTKNKVFLNYEKVFSENVIFSNKDKSIYNKIKNKMSKNKNTINSSINNPNNIVESLNIQPISENELDNILDKVKNEKNINLSNIVFTMQHKNNIIKKKGKMFKSLFSKK